MIPSTVYSYANKVIFNSFFFSFTLFCLRCLSNQIITFILFFHLHGKFSLVFIIIFCWQNLSLFSFIQSYFNHHQWNVNADFFIFFFLFFKKCHNKCELLVVFVFLFSSSMPQIKDARDILNGWKTVKEKRIKQKNSRYTQNNMIKDIQCNSTTKPINHTGQMKTLTLLFPPMDYIFLNGGILTYSMNQWSIFHWCYHLV